MMDLEREHVRKNYQLCRTAFFLLAVSLVPVCIVKLLFMIALLGDRNLARWVTNPQLEQWLSTLCIWGSLAGTMLLWGRWNQASWQRRTGLLLLMSVVDLVLWFLERDQAIHGQPDWFQQNLGVALGWAEFALLAGLTGDFLVHLGLEQADESAKSTRSLAATGAVVWMLYFCEATNWDGGWPLHGRLRGFQGYILYLAWNLIWTITLVQVTALIVAAVRHANRTLWELRREEQEQEVLPWPVQSPKDDLLGAGGPAAGFDHWTTPA